MVEMILQGSKNPKMLEAIIATLEDKEGVAICSQKDALVHIGKKAQNFNENKDEQPIINYALNLLDRDLFPHMGKSKEFFRHKAFYLGYIAHKILRVKLELTPQDNRDHCARRIFELAGPLLEDIFCEVMETLCRDIKSILSRWIKDGKPIQDISTLLKKRSISQKFRYVIATGNWTCNTNKRTNKTGVTAVLQRVSFASELSHKRRLNTPIGREGKLSKPRQLHWDTFGMIDPAETPEGVNVGLVNNMGLSAHISMGDSSFHLMDIIINNGLIPLDKIVNEELLYWRIFVNGKWIGMIKKSNEIINLLKKMKRSTDINYETSISYKHRERSVLINTNSGRIMRPLLIVENGKLKLTKERVESLRKEERYKDSFTVLLGEGIVEMMDVTETDNALIAMFVRDLEDLQKTYTHCEIHPCLIYGEIVGSIPNLNHNPTPRGTFQGAMGKQALGIPTIDFLDRMDTMMHVLCYPQKPITSTKTSRLVGMDDLPAGAEAIVMLACDTGENVEDAIIINRRCLDLGMFRSFFYRTYKDVEQKLGNSYSEEFKKPNREKCHGMRPGNELELGEDGIVDPGTFISGDDYIIGKTSAYVGNNPQFTEKDHSQLNKNSEHGIVDRVMLTTNEEGFKITKVKVRSVRIPIMGDKYII